MDNLKYHIDTINNFKKQLKDVHIKYQKQLQNKNSNKLAIFINKKNEILNLMEKQKKYNITAFSYVCNYFIKYIYKLNYKINREKLKKEKKLCGNAENVEMLFLEKMI